MNYSEILTQIQAKKEIPTTHRYRVTCAIFDCLSPEEQNRMFPLILKRLKKMVCSPIKVRSIVYLN